MSKFFKLGLVLSVLAFSMVACVKPISTIGTYKSGDYLMTVMSDGQVSFSYNGDKTDRKATDSVEETLSSVISGGLLKPWDLGAVSTASVYEVKYDIMDYSVGNSEGKLLSTATITFKFKTDTTKVTCDVEISGVPDGYGKNGKVTFTK